MQDKGKETDARSIETVNRAIVPMLYILQNTQLLCRCDAVFLELRTSEMVNVIVMGNMSVCDTKL